MRLDAILPEAPEALAALDVTGVTADSRAVAPGDLFFAIAGAKADGLRFAPQALAAGAVAIVGETSPKDNDSGELASAPFVAVERRAQKPVAGRRRAASAPAGKDRRGHRHVGQDLGRRFHPADFPVLRLCRRLARHHRRDQALGRGLWLADHAGPGDPAQDARRAGGRRRHPSRDGSLVARPRPAPARRRAADGGRLHQSLARPSRLSFRPRRLSRRQIAAVPRSAPARPDGGDRRRRRLFRPRDRGLPRARPAPVHGGRQRRRHQAGRGARRKAFRCGWPSCSRAATSS